MTYYRWNHVNIVSYLIDYEDCEERNIEKALRKTTNLEIIRILRRKQNGINGKLIEKGYKYFCYKN